MLNTRRALYGKMAGDTTLTNLLGAPPSGFAKNIFYQEAPQGAGFPYVIFNEQAETPAWALSEKAYDDDIWLIKGVDENSDADRVDTIKARLEALLTDATLSISGETLLYLRPESKISYQETTDGVRYLHAGLLFRLIHDTT